MDNWESIIGNIASIFSIISLPITLFQIWKIRSTTKHIEKAILNFLKLEEVSTINKIFEVVTTQKVSLSSIFNNASKEGSRAERLKKDCEGYIKEIDTCINNLPTEFTNVESLMINSVNCIQEYITDGDKMKIKEGESFLRDVIFQLKKIKEKNKRMEIETISRNK